MSERTRFLWRAFRSRFRDHKAELSAILSYIQQGDLVCDVGANKRSFLYWLSKWSAHGRVVAFEPQRDLADYLTRICTDLPLQNVTIEPKAVFSETGSREFFVPKGHKPGASLSREGLSYAAVETVHVPIVALDDYFGANERISVLKIDVEGAEIGVFKGAERILRKDLPLLVFERESRHLGGRPISDVFRYLEGLGYRGSFIQRGHVFPVSQFREEVHQHNDGQWFWKRPGYCSNFVFTPAR
ncbi:FkbM family methyltransferase [Bradyrhizobium sp. URHA0013]|uniref:FkbM family methyltransferase n=1 Tax=Bradyrhizobium sp. URHA0013 TaxID=1380352 RepID=UPI0009DFF52C|nr:FkbM family methyltransferase [Bradyrhizobium sp. URHA0013]